MDVTLVQANLDCFQATTNPNLADNTNSFQFWTALVVYLNKPSNNESNFYTFTWFYY